MTFSSDELLQQHKVSGHSLKGVPILLPDSLPSPEFVETIKRIEQKENPPEVLSVKPQDAPQSPIEAVRLTYTFKGFCPKDKVGIKTLEMDVIGKHFCLAVCPVCDKVWQQREVANLDTVVYDDNHGNDSLCERIQDDIVEVRLVPQTITPNLSNKSRRGGVQRMLRSTRTSNARQLPEEQGPWNPGGDGGAGEKL